MHWQKRCHWQWSSLPEGRKQKLPIKWGVSRDPASESLKPLHKIDGKLPEMKKNLLNYFENPIDVIINTTISQNFGLNRKYIYVIIKVRNKLNQSCQLSNQEITLSEKRLLPRKFLMINQIITKKKIPTHTNLNYYFLSKNKALPPLLLLPRQSLSLVSF